MEENKPQPNSAEGLQVLRTYSSDMADAVRNNEMSVIKIAMAEQKRHEMEKVYEEEKKISTSKILMIIGGLILIVSSIAGLYFIFQKKNADNAVQQAIIKPNALISYDDQSYIDVTNVSSGANLVNLIKSEAAKPEKQGAIKSLFLTANANGSTALIKLRDFLSLMGVTASSSLIDSFSDRYMIGTYTPADKPHLFLLFEIKDYNQAYAGMLAWERSLLSDMFLLFQIDISGSNSGLLNASWKDIIINNKDARVLYDQNNNPLLYYIFIDKNNFVIADSQDTIKEIISRLLTQNTKPL
ncbi:MAG TPA: hypothetical protein VMR49_02360 [Candidatus Paceibacterota bacterium]|nr:hypothetical protein [Candidatus Paceibacterota bacterium]